ncbi:hypothetical protein [Bartonella sp. WD16.2]|nr:hypothetical protein [Bartonella sp. WD16.2]
MKGKRGVGIKGRGRRVSEGELEVCDMGGDVVGRKRGWERNIDACVG